MWYIDMKVSSPTAVVLMDIKHSEGDGYGDGGVFVDGVKTDKYPELFARAQAIYDTPRVAENTDRYNAWQALKMDVYQMLNQMRRSVRR